MKPSGINSHTSESMPVILMKRNSDLAKAAEADVVEVEVVSV